MKIMECRQQSERTPCRLIVFSPDRREILLKHSEAGFVLPLVEISRWERITEALTALLMQEWGFVAVCVFSLDLSQESMATDSDRYVVLEYWQGVDLAEMAWRPTHTLTARAFFDQHEFGMLRRCVHQLETYEHDLASPFARSGWFNSIRDWTAAVIRPLGFELIDSFRQLNASVTFSLIRFETTGPSVWFKAVGDPNLREFAITLKLAELSPSFVPTILGIKPEWNAWLAGEIDGVHLNATSDSISWERAATNLANLQIESISYCESLLSLGAHDLRPEVLFPAIPPLFDLVAYLMDQQAKAPPPILTRKELQLIRIRVDDALTMLKDLRVPLTLGHLDLNPGNIIVSTQGSAFLDWAEGYVGHPFVSFQYLLEHARRSFGLASEIEANMIRAYCAQWRSVMSPAAIATALRSAPLLAVFVYAAASSVLKMPINFKDSSVGGYVRSLARRMHREAQSLDRPIISQEQAAAC